jgi:hypothetical protein
VRHRRNPPGRVSAARAEVKGPVASGSPRPMARAAVACDKSNDSHCLTAPLCDTLFYMSKASIPPILAIRLPPMDRAALERAARR